MWTEMTIVSRDYQGEVSSRTVLRSRNDDDFVDFSIEEYTGMSRRAKLCNVRLEGPAARAVYALLAEKFANTRTGD
jgi:hypothetical protein